MLNNCQGYLCLRQQLKRRKIIRSHLSGVHYLGQFSGWQFFGSNYHWSIILSEISLGAGCPGANYLGGEGGGAITGEAIFWGQLAGRQLSAGQRCGRQLSGVQLSGRQLTGVQRSGGELSGVQLQWGQLPRGNYPEGNCAVPKDPIHIIIWRI